jgi:plastocyanin
MRAMALVFLVVAACTSKPAAPVKHKVTIEAFQFRPSTLTVKPGDEIVFTNNDTMPHTVTPTVKGSFGGIDRLLSGESGTVVMAKAGTYAYFCELHTTMTGTLVVQ